MATDMTVANEIRNQIGNMAFRMIGAKDLMGDEKSLKFRIGRNAKAVTHIRVTLLPSDTYQVEFFRIRGTTVKVVASEDMIYNDGLRSAIERNTGLYTSF